MTERNTEIEIKLVIAAPDPAAMAAAIAGLDAIAGYSLRPRPERRIRDVYLDTPDRDLERRRLALRLRDVNGAQNITLKGPARPHPSGALERLEVEEEWSDEALGQVLERLASEGVPERIAVPKRTEESPLDRMLTLGFTVVQDRRTQRRVREIEDPRLPVALAELVIDAVRIGAGKDEAVHREIEIERKREDGDVAVASVAAALRQRFSAALRPWAHSKLATVAAIEELLRQGALQAARRADGTLLPEAYDRIAEQLR